jgi:hypothetical protein
LPLSAELHFSARLSIALWGVDNLVQAEAQLYLSNAVFTARQTLFYGTLCCPAKHG